MGIMVPRPAMRRREARIVMDTLKQHEYLASLMRMSGGVSYEWASKVAFNIISTSNQIYILEAKR